MAKVVRQYIEKSPIVGKGTDPKDVLPKGKIINATVALILPKQATREEIMEWFCFCMGFGSMSSENPLADCDPDIAGEPILSETEFAARREEEDE